jgi:hypothetical protein
MHGKYIYVPFRGCNDCFGKITNLADAHSESLNIIIVSENKADRKALEAVYGVKENYLITDNYNKDLINSSEIYFISAESNKIVEMTRISIIELDDWIYSFQINNGS